MSKTRGHRRQNRSGSSIHEATGGKWWMEKGRIGTGHVIISYFSPFVVFELLLSPFEASSIISFLSGSHEEIAFLARNRGARDLSRILRRVCLLAGNLWILEIRAKGARIMEWRELNGQIGRRYILVVLRWKWNEENEGLCRLASLQSSKVSEL